MRQMALWLKVGVRAAGLILRWSWASCYSPCWRL